jgi:hypothetical protein
LHAPLNEEEDVEGEEEEIVRLPAHNGKGRCIGSGR